MRILIVTDYGVPVGGAEIQTLRLRERLREEGHDARLLASTAFAGDGGGPRADEWCRGSESSARTLLQSANPWAYRALGRVLGEFQPDVVHVAQHLTQLSPAILARLRRPPSLYHAQWYRSICPLGTKHLPTGRACREPWGAACLRNRCLPRRDWPLLTLQLRWWHRWRGAFDLVVANSETTRRALSEAGIGPIETVWDGVPIPARASLPAGPPRVVFAGRLVPEKGVDVLLRGFAQVLRGAPAATLLVAGEGPERGRLERLASELRLGDRVTFTGHLERTALERRLAGAWVQAVPSVWEEPFGLVAAEAMARGTPVVASEVGGLREIVNHEETGYLVPAGEPGALAAALSRTLQDRDRAARMGRCGRRRAEARFGEQAMVSSFLDIYARLAARGVTTTPTTRPAVAAS